ncbi:MaoC/PaaZ C-terminal domain-containing protein [Nocardioides lianchengensis]|uniref:Acyl dehydratase n=1 Tax=Nocardioides lianchengensis TaxID=1045774 RepID=A0A1G6R942_9ACTN|nr:MaoC/PaaZ C-terminal domain-containing protein [Nocardioides lianchengensis]NYG10316.1 acyl dehydratase [Nocardioides lianchengensis]SDD01142.1 Acyl dehydratase [Nocardioides lianchengensis]
MNALLRAALPSIPLVNQLPGIRKAPAEDFSGLRLTRPPVTAERAHVERYAAVCGFPVKDTVPVTYPHLLAFPLHLAIMGDQAFPAPAIGSVHVENSITTHRPVAVGETLEVEVAVGAAQPHAKGTAYVFATTISAGGETAWESTSTYLRRGKGDDSAAGGTSYPDAPPHGITWRLPDDLGRRYAAVSGDHNPIHLYPLTAKALGFPRQIAHGMWTLARSVAALENRLPDAVRVDAAFKKPVLLPGTVAFGSARLEDGYAFSLSRPRDGAPHLVGRTTAL